MRGFFAFVGLISLTSLTFAEPGRPEQPPAIKVPDEHAWTDEVRARFMAAYELKPGESLKLVAPPFLPERQAYYWHRNPRQAAALPEGPHVMAIQRIQDERPGGMMSWGPDQG